MLVRMIIIHALLIATSAGGAETENPPEPARFEARAGTAPVLPSTSNRADTLPSRSWDDRQAEPGEMNSSGEQPASMIQPLPAATSHSLALPAPNSAGAQTSGGSFSTILYMMASLAIVLGLFMIVAWLLKRGLPQTAQQLPREVVEVLGRTTLAPRQVATLIRVGNKLLLVSMTPTGAETLTEITEPAEVDRLTGVCGESHPHSATNAFRQVFQQFARQHEKQPDHAGGPASARESRGETHAA